MRLLGRSVGPAIPGLSALLLASLLISPAQASLQDPDDPPASATDPITADEEPLAVFSEQNATAQQALALLAATPAALGLTPLEKAELLKGAIEVLKDVPGQGAAIEQALEERYRLYEQAAGTRDHIWAQRVEDHARWLLEQRRYAEALDRQRDALEAFEESFGADHPALYPHAQFLRDAMAAAGEPQSDLARLDREIGQLAAAQPTSTSAVVAMGPGDPRPVGAGEQAVEKVRVFYATNRQAVVGRRWFGDPHYSGEPGPMMYGLTEVWVPQRDADPVRRAALWSIEVAPDRLKRSAIVGLRRIPTADRFHSLVRRDAASRQILIYVHGYNVTFSESVKVAANLAVDLDIKGPPIVYSWPSAGSVLSYWRDSRVIEDQANRLGEQFEQLVSRVAATNPGAKIYVLAHSMGNRVVLDGLARLAASRPATRLSAVVLASPDVGTSRYASLAGRASRIANRLTVYASRKDRALRVSSVLNGEARAGYPRTLPPGSPGDKIDTTIDDVAAAGLSGDLLGHSDYMRGALVDLRSQMWFDAPPARRCILRPVGHYFAFRNASCALLEYSDALVAVRRLGGKANALRFAGDRMAVSAGAQERARWARVRDLISRAF